MSPIRGLILLTFMYCVNVSVALPSVRTRTPECEIRYRSADRMVDACHREHFYGFPRYQHTATQESARQWLQETCANVPNFLSCVANVTNTEGSGCNNVDDVMRAVVNAVAFCDESSWMRRYALPNIGTIEYACLRIKRTLCVDIVDLLQYPTEETSLTDGLAMARSNVEIAFDCMVTEFQQKIPSMPGCSATWQEVLFLFLMQIATGMRLGVSLYPDQIQQLPNIAV